MNIIAQIDTGNLSVDEYFSIAMHCSKLLSTGESNDEREVRTIAIHILNNWTNIPSELYPIWTDIIEAVGFYPYLEKNPQTMKMQCLSDEVRQKHFYQIIYPQHIYIENKRNFPNT